MLQSGGIFVEQYVHMHPTPLPPPPSCLSIVLAHPYRCEFPCLSGAAGPLFVGCECLACTGQRIHARARTHILSLPPPLSPSLSRTHARSRARTHIHTRGCTAYAFSAMFMHGETEAITFFRSHEARFNKDLRGRSKFVVCLA